MIQSMFFICVLKQDVISSYMQILHVVYEVYCSSNGAGGESIWPSVIGILIALVGVVVTLIGMVVTLVGVFVAYKINDSVQAAECTKMYFSKEMLHAIRTLFKIEISERKTSSLCRKDKEGGEMPWTEEEDEARRLVKSYFQLAYELRYKRFLPISKNTLRQICDVDALPLYFDVIRRMELALNKEYNRAPFLKLKRECKDIYEDKKKQERKDITFMKRDEVLAKGWSMNETVTVEEEKDEDSPK